VKRIGLSPSALKAFLACRRSWWLQFSARVDRIVPPYVTAGSALDQVVQDYLTSGAEPVHLPMGSPELAELAVLKSELPAPGSVLVQKKFTLSCPGLEVLVDITTGGLDYLTPPNLDLMVIGDLKRIWHKDAAMTPDQLAANEQAQMYAWLVWQVYNPAEIIWNWTYCVRETRNATTGAVTRKAKAFCVTVKADRAKVEAWFASVVLPAARAMLEIRDSARAAEAVEHDPTSCEEGARCFVRHHCPLYQGPVRGEQHNMVDLSRFKTNKSSPVPPLAQAVEEQRARIAINPPALDPKTNVPIAQLFTGSLTAAQVRDMMPSPRDEREADLEVTTIEGPGAALLATEDDGIDAVEDKADAAALAEARPTEPAPAPEAPEPPAPKARRRRAKAQGAAAAIAEQAALSLAAAPEKQELSAHERECVLDALCVEDATTEALVWELRDRGWVVSLTAGAL
jgi:hypothetical protein